MVDMIEQPFIVTMAFDVDLALTLDALNIPYACGDNAIRVEMNTGIDGRLERLVGRLSEMRWSYEPGRAIQVELPGFSLYAMRG